MATTAQHLARPRARPGSRAARAASAAASGPAALEGLRGKRFPAFVLRPKARDDDYTVVFAQFTFGLGVGDSLEEAMEDAEYVLALNLCMALIESAARGQAHPPGLQALQLEPVGMEEARRLVENTRRELGLAGGVDDADWVMVEVKPEAVQDEEWDWISA